jgi:hypothetical protein
MATNDPQASVSRVFSSQLRQLIGNDELLHDLVMINVGCTRVLLKKQLA